MIGCFSAANSALTIPSRSSEGTSFLVKILDVLESVSLATVGYHPSNSDISISPDESESDCK